MATHELTANVSSGPITDNSYVFGAVGGSVDTAPDVFPATVVYDYIKSKTDLVYATVGQLSNLSDSALLSYSNIWQGKGYATSGFSPTTDVTGLATYGQLANAISASAQIDINGLDALTGVGIDTALDKLVIYDTSAAENKSVTPDEFVDALAASLLPITTRGDILTRDATDNIRLALGATNSILVSDGTDPSWSASPTLTALTLTSGLTVGASSPFSDSAGTLTLQNVDALDATTEATIEAAIDTLANLGSIQGQAFTFGAYAPTLLNNANEAAFKAAVNLEAGTDFYSISAADSATTAAIAAAVGVSVQAYDADITAVGALNSTGLAVRTGANTWAQRTLTAPAAGLSITNPAGVAGDPTFALVNDLSALEGLASTGFAVRSASDTWVQRSLANAAAGLTWTNGDGVSGNPTPVFANDLGAVEGLATTGLVRRTATDTWSAGNLVTTAEITDANVTYAKIQNVSATDKVLGRSTAGAGVVEEISCTTSGRAMIAAASAAAQTALLSVVVGDSGSGGTKGLVPAPVAGDASKALFGDGTFKSIPGGGDALIANPLSQFAATTSAQLRSVLSDETGTGFAYFQGGDIGTPSAGVGTNLTGIPLTGLVSDTTTALGLGSINLGHATDTTLSRASAGQLAVEGVNVLMSGGALGTPSSGTGTNLTGIPLTGLTSDTTTALGIGSINLGHASDTTIARVSAGVVSIEGSNIIMASNKLSALSATTSTELAGVISDETGSGALVFAVGPTFSSTVATTATDTHTNTTDNATVATAIFEGDRATMAANDAAYIDLKLSDSAGNQDPFARIKWQGTTVTSTSEVGKLLFGIGAGGTITDEVEITATAMSPVSSDGNALGTTSLMWSDLFLASGAVVNFNNGDVTITHATDLLTIAGGGLQAAAGTTAIAPLALQSGTNLTTATAGAFEFDGTALMFTPLGTQRGILKAEQFFLLDTNLAGSNATGAQNIFGKSVTLSSSTIYMYVDDFVLNKSAGTTSHTVGLGFGGTATFSWTKHSVIFTSTLPGPTANGTPIIYNFEGMTNATFSAATTTAAVEFRIKRVSFLSCTAGGTIIPQYTLSAAPGGAYSTERGSYAAVASLGVQGANVSIGTWA